MVNIHLKCTFFSSKYVVNSFWRTVSNDHVSHHITTVANIKHNDIQTKSIDLLL